MRSFIGYEKGGKMTKFKKIGEIHGFKKDIDKEDIKEIDNYLNEFCNKFNLKKELITQKNFYVLTADTKNPYRQLYAHV